MHLLRWAGGCQLLSLLIRLTRACTHCITVTAAGGMLSDWAAKQYGMRGRLWAMWICLAVGPGFCIGLGFSDNSIAATMVTLVFFAFFVQVHFHLRSCHQTHAARFLRVGAPQVLYSDPERHRCNVPLQAGVGGGRDGTHGTGSMQLCVPACNSYMT